MALSIKPPKGTRDWAPDEFRKRKYIFDTWRSVCERYGYKEYLTPIVEHADVYRAKSGEDVGGAELVTFEDRGGRELSVRPEMTPSVTRMVSGMYESAPKPLRLFSIANFMRNERPQRGRNREFWQLNADLFGDESVYADVEVLQMALDLMLAFKPPTESFVLRINSRNVIDTVLAQAHVSEDHRQDVVRILDKWAKLTPEQIAEKLTAAGVLSEGQNVITSYMNGQDIGLVDVSDDQTDSFNHLKKVIELLTVRGYGDYIAFAPEIIRGFDYYDGIIFEVFDLHPDNSRALFGGGRYNGLAGIFGRAPFPSVGFAPGDETMYLFLESWGLFDALSVQTPAYYMPILDDTSETYVQNVACTLRDSGKHVTTGLSVQPIGKAFKAAEKGGFTHVVLAGENEQDDSVYIVKDLRSGDEEKISFG